MTGAAWSATRRRCCGAHHFAIHQGWVRVSGRAPDHLVWELGELEEPAFVFHWPGAAA